jgi:hypothetical protein
LTTIPSTLVNLTELYCGNCPSLIFIGVTDRPQLFNAKNTLFENYDFNTHKDKFKYRIAARRVCNFFYRNYIKKQKEKVLAVHLWRFGLGDVKDIVLRNLVRVSA